MDNEIRDIDLTEYKVLDIAENLRQGNTTDSDDIETDSDVIEKLKDMTALAEAADSQMRSEDVEERLQQFYRNHQEKSPRRPLWRIAVASAACIAVLVTLTVWKGTTGSREELEEQPLVYNIAKPKASIVVKSENGGEMRTMRKITDSEEYVVESITEDCTEAATERLVVDVPQGEKLTVALPDGSKVYLHAGSRLKFPTHFTNSERVVELTGEAYFVVAHNPDMPFIVNTPTMKAIVLGTEFNIASESATLDNVALVSGSVRVEAAGTRHTMRPGQQLTVSAGRKVTVQMIDTTPYTSWRDGYIYIDNVTLKEAVLQIAREFNCNVEFRSRGVLDNKVHFVALRSDGIKGIVDGLNMMGVVSVVMENNTLIVM